MNHQLNKSNLQEPKKNEDGSYSIPTIVNGVTSVNSNAKLEQKYSDSVEISINPFSGEFIITMSHLPGWVLIFKIPRARPFY